MQSFMFPLRQSTSVHGLSCYVQNQPGKHIKHNKSYLHQTKWFVKTFTGVLPICTMDMYSVLTLPLNLMIMPCFYFKTICIQGNPLIIFCRIVQAPTEGLTWPHCNETTT